MVRDSTKSSTIPSEASGGKGRETFLRTGAVGFVWALVLLGLTGLLGVRTDIARSSDNGYELAVTHAEVTRPGLATPFHLTVSRTDGGPLPAEVTTRIDARYLEMFDENGLDPDPVGSFSTSESAWWTFAIPPGENRLEVSFDVRLEPSVQWGRTGSVSLEVDGVETIGVEFRTWVLP